MQPAEYEVLQVLIKGPKTFTELRKETKYTDKSVWTALTKLESNRRVEKKQAEWGITDRGRDAHALAKDFLELRLAIGFLSLGMDLDHAFGERAPSRRATLVGLRTLLHSLEEFYLDFVAEAKLDVVTSDILLRRPTNTKPTYTDLLSGLEKMTGLVDGLCQRDSSFESLRDTTKILVNSVKSLVEQLQQPHAAETKPKKEVSSK